MIKAVLFDMGGTLITSCSPQEILQIYDRILRAHGIKRSLDEIAAAKEKADERFDIRQLVDFGRNFWIEYNRLLVEELGVKEREARVLAETIDREWWSYADVELHPDVLPVLNELKAKKVKLGLISNGLESDIEYVMRKVGLEGFFDVEVGADTFRSMKPDKEIFLRTLEKLGVSADEALFVGDSLENDYKGAENAGIKALLIDRKNVVGDCQVEKIRSLWELLRLV